jgi:hypothetical protein
MATGKTLSNPRLFHLLQGVLAQWIFLGADMAPEDASSAGPWLEYMVKLGEPAPAVLVLRCSHAAAALIAASATGSDDADEATAADAFRELANVVCGNVMDRYLKRGAKPFATFLPVPSTPQDWPAGRPDYRCVALVEGHGVEAMVWDLVPATVGRR